jgi:calcineurin-like phosphoesterase family protein
MKIVCLSDTHGVYQPDNLPDGDVLIHAGDLSLTGEPHEIEYALGWLRKLPHKYKIFIGGNHDNALAEMPGLFEHLLRPYKDCTPLIYLCGRTVKVEGLTVFGSSVIPHNNAFRAGARAYMLDATTARHWGRAPKCDILISHGPPKGILDTEQRFGDPCLLAYVRQIKPKLHVFGHVHYGRGTEESLGTKFVNASLLDEAYRPACEPTVVEI